MKLKIFSMIAFLVVSFGFLGASFSQPVMASEISNESIVELQQNEPNSKQPRLVWWAAMLIGAGVVWLVGEINILGGYAACKKWNDSNWAMDYYCDANGYFRD